MIKVALEIKQQMGCPVAIFGNNIMMLEKYDLYNPTDNIHQNILLGKFVDEQYITGDNFQQIEAILDKTESVRVRIPNNYENFMIIS